VKLATVFGVVARLGTPVAIRSATGRMTGGYAVYDLELELEDATIDLDHDADEVAGQVIYAEITPEDQFAVVGVVDGTLAEIEMYVIPTSEIPARPPRACATPEARRARRPLGH
jgi:hypothetical protein